MQLTPKPSLRKTLTALTAVLIGGSAAHAATSNKLESSLLLYSESDRVQAAESIVILSRALPGGRFLSGRLTYDALTGPSPNGAAPANRIQTFTRPSGSGGYTAAPGETPLDDTFKDTRVSLDGSYSQPLDRLTTFDVGAHFSTEHDYTSLGANIELIRDFNRKNTTFSLSASFSHDLVRPEGGTPEAFSSMKASGEDEGEIESEKAILEDDESEGGGGGSNETKNTIDAVLGLTQVLNRQTLLRFNYSFSHTSGYLNDPYKILSVVQGRSAAEPGEPVDYLYESRPGKRTRHAVFGQVLRDIKGHTVDISYRYFWDDWGITSHTVDFRYRLPLGGGHALQPHVRWYKQTEADFYRSYLVDGARMPVNASADYRLAPFHAVTIGLQYFIPVTADTHFSIGAEYYFQSGDISPPGSFGALSRFDLFPDLKAVMVRAGLSYDF